MVSIELFLKIFRHKEYSLNSLVSPQNKVFIVEYNSVGFPLENQFCDIVLKRREFLQILDIYFN
ncbi:hypothetical protein CVD23_11920 [Bacillus sp. V33-4]|nr:hypothetical protein CVD23_11920 [Bacillus sp. V33-4]